MKKCVALALVIVCLLYALVGCGKKNNQDAVYYLNFKPEIADVYTKIASDYERETGKSLRVVTAASGTYEQTLKSEISKSDAPAIFQFNGPVGYQTWKNYCANLQNTEIYRKLNDSNIALKDENGVWGIPYVVEGYGIIYNKAITDAYLALPGRRTTIQSMDDIRSFEMLKAVVEDMSSRKAELGIDGVFASTSLKSGEDWRWTTHLANVALHYEFRDNNTDLTDLSNTKQVSFKYSDEFKNLFDLYINHSTTNPKLLGSKQVADSMAEFALGKCAMVQTGNWAWSQISQVSGNTVKKENIRMMPIFMGIDGEENQGICIGTENYLAINSQLPQAQQEAAADFLLWLYSSETGKEYVSNELEFIAPFNTFGDDDKPEDPLSKDVMNWMEKDNIHNVTWDFVVFPSQNFKDAFGAALLQYAQGTKTWAQVKEIFVNTWASENS